MSEATVTAVETPRVDRGGVARAASAYVLWGALPAYLKLFHGVLGAEVVACRILFSLVFLGGLLGVRGELVSLRSALSRPVLLRFAASAALISANWFTYVWSVGSGRVVDASFGYFINPLVNVLIGAIVLKERLRRGQWLSVAIAASGVVFLTLQSGELPWIGLFLAITFGMYGFLRKTATLGATQGLMTETLLLAPFALVGVAWLAMHGESAFVAGPWSMRWLLVGAGPVTAIPLVLFAAGARRIPLSLLGLLQYVGPTLQLLLGVFAYHERLHGARLAGFGIIWAALVVYSVEGLVAVRARST